MDTAYFVNDTGNAAELLIKGGLVAVPTETVYGLACNGLDPEAVKKVYEVKGRPTVKPLSLMVESPADMELYCENVCSQAKALAERFWPGPLTIVLNSKDYIPDIVRAGGDTVGLRCPDSPITLKLLNEARIPFAAPSANPSGMESPKTAKKVMEYFDGQIEAVIDGGECCLGKESTIIDMSATPYRILRQGALSEPDIKDVLVNNLKIIGITGGSGCGKTSALAVLKDMDALILDCDEIYHELLLSDEEMLQTIRHRFPSAFEGEVFNRKKLGNIVFNDRKALLELNEITHKYVRLEIIRRLREYAFNGGKTAAIDAIELISSKLGEICDIRIAVSADRNLRIERIMARDGISREYAESRIDAQHSDDYFKKGCDAVIYNNGSVEEFKNKFSDIIKEVTG